MSASNLLQTEPWLPMPLYQLVVGNRPTILALFRLVYILTIANIGIGIVLYLLEPLTYYSIMLELGKNFGSLAALTYCVTLFPSIAQRLKILPKTAALFTLWRRQFGVSMFLFAVTHMMLVRTLPLLFTDPTQILNLNSHLLAGFVALTILLPLWLTSNDPSKKFLGPWWKRLHRLTYVALVAIMIHVALRTSSMAIVLGCTLVAEAISWLVYWRRPQMTPPPAPTV